MNANGVLMISVISSNDRNLYYVDVQVIIEQMKMPHNQNKVEVFLNRLENQMFLENGSLTIEDVKNQVLKKTDFEGVISPKLAVTGFTSEDFQKLKDLSFLHPNFLFTFERKENGEYYRIYIRNSELKYVEGKVIFPEYS